MASRANMRSGVRPRTPARLDVRTRTCIGCRQPALATELVRLMVVDGQVRPVVAGRQAGRGASIHPREACVAAAVKTQAFARAFRGAVSPFVRGEKSQSIKSDDALKVLIDDIEVAHALQQSRAGRTP